MKNITILIALSILLSGCSPTSFFSKIARTNEEQGASEAVDLLKIKEVKLAKIEAKKQSFPQSVELTKKEGDEIEKLAYAYRNRYQVDNKSVIDIEAYLPNLDKGYYEAWLVGDDPKKPLSIGAIEYKGNSDYQLTFESTEDLTNLAQIFITIEEVADDQPETAIMAGVFGSEAANNN